MFVSEMANEIDTPKLQSPMFTPKEFKKVLQNKENVVNALRQFLEQSQSRELTSFEDPTQEGGQNDVILELLKSEDSHGESSLVKLMDDKLKPSEAVTIISFFHAILHRIANDLSQYELWGLAVTKQLLYPTRINRLKRGLMDGDHLVLNKVTLRLLTTMVGLGAEAAREVVKNLPLNAKLVKPLLYKIDNVNKASDVCSMTIDFLVAFFELEDDDLTSKLVEQKGLLNDVFDVLPYLRAPSIHDFFAALTSQVINNKSIYKTLKISIFNNATLLPVMRLLDWKGPRPFKLKKKKNRKGDMPSEELTEEIARIRQLAQEFILSVLSPRTGITFHDPTCGTTAENANHLLIQLLPPAYNQVKSPMMCDVIIQVLKWCPDQVYRFFGQLCDQLKPRLTPQWMAHISVVRKIIASQDLPAILAAVDPLLSIETRVQIVLRLSTVQEFRGTVSKEMLCNSDISMRHEALLYVIAVLEQVECLCSIDSTEVFKLFGSDLKTFRNMLWTKLLVMLPSFDDVCHCWTLAANKPSIEETDVPDSGAVAPVDLFEHFQYLIKVIAIYYRQTSPKSTVQRLAEIWGSLEHVHRLLSADKAMKIQITISRLVVDAGLGKSLLLQKFNGKNAVFVILELINKDLEQSVRVSLSSLLEQLLLSTNHFDPNELKMILRIFLVQPTKSDTVLQFFHDVLIELIDNFQAIEDLVKTIQIDDTGNAQDEVYEKMLEEVLDMDIEDLEGPLDSICHKPYLSSLVYLSLKQLDSVNDDDKSPRQEFVTAFLYDVLHSHDKRQALCTLLTQGHLNLPKDLQRYIPYLDPSKQFHSLHKVKRRKIRNAYETNVSAALRHSFLTNSLSSAALEDDDDLEALITSLTDYETCIAYRQTLCYIELLLAKEDGDVNLFCRFCHILSKLVFHFGDGSISTHDIEAINSTRDLENRESLMREMETALINSLAISRFFLDWDLLTDSGCPKAKAVSELVLDLAARVQLDRVNLIADCRSYQDRATDFIHRAMRLSAAGQHRPSTLIPSVRVMSPFLRRLPPIAFRKVIDVDWSLSTDSSKNDLGQLLVLLLDYLTQAHRPLVAPSKRDASDSDHNVITTDDVTTRIAQSLLNLLSANRLYAFLVSWGLFESLLDTLTLPFHSPLAQLLLDSNSENLVIFENWLLEHGVPNDACHFHPLAGVFLEKLSYDPDSVSASENRQRATKLLAEYYWPRLTVTLSQSEPDAELNDNLLSGLLTAIVDLRLASSRKQLDLLQRCVGSMSAKRVRALSHVHSSIGKSNLTIRGYSPASCQVVMSLKAVVDWFVEELSGMVGHHDDCLIVINAVASTLLDNTSPLPALGELIHGEKLSQRLIKTTLKVALTDPSGAGALRLLVVLLGRLHRDGQATHFMAGSIFELLLGHSNFLPGLLSKDQKYLEWKNSLLDLLVLLTDMDPSVCRATLVPMYLSAYGASLSPADQKLLRLLYVCEAQGTDCSSYRPFLWGEAAATHYSLLKDLRHTLMKQPTTLEILGLLKFERLLKTAYNFPLSLPLSLDVTPEFCRLELDADLYDPRFLLPLFSQLVAPESLLHTWWFINSNALSVVFAALASEDDSMRAAAYHVIKDLYAHLEGSRFAQSSQWLYLFDWLANGIPVANLRLSNIVTIFLVEMTRLLLDPTQATCPPMIAFLTVKPALDVYRVPNFLQMFHLTDQKLHTQCRTWMLGLLRDGLRVPADYALCNKIYVFKVMMGFLKSGLSTRTHVPQILDVVHSAVRVPGISDDLFIVRGLTPFLLSVLPDCDTTTLVKIMQILSAASNQVLDTARGTVPDDIMFLLVRALPHLNPRLPHEVLETTAATMASIVEWSRTRNDGGFSSSDNMLTAASVQQLIAIYGDLFQEHEQPIAEGEGKSRDRAKLAASLCSVFLSWNCDGLSTLNDSGEESASNHGVFLVVCRLLLIISMECEMVVTTLGSVYQWIERQLRRDRSFVLLPLLAGQSSGGDGVVDRLLQSYGRLLLEDGSSKLGSGVGVRRDSLRQLNRLFLFMRKGLQRCGNGNLAVENDFLRALVSTDRSSELRKLAKRMKGEDVPKQSAAAVSIAKLFLELWLKPDVDTLFNVADKFLSPVSADVPGTNSPDTGSTKRSSCSESVASTKSKRRKSVHV